MKVSEANKLINKIMDESPVEAEIFISMLARAYIDEVGITKEKFFKSLKNSIDIFEKADKFEKEEE